MARTVVRWCAAAVLGAATLVTSPAAASPPADGYPVSTGAGGAWTIDASGTLNTNTGVFTVAGVPAPAPPSTLNAVARVFNLTTLTIAESQTLTVVGVPPVEFRASGAITLERFGTINASATLNAPGAGGGTGGAGASGTGQGNPGTGSFVPAVGGGGRLGTTVVGSSGCGGAGGSAGGSSGQDSPACAANSGDGAGGGGGGGYAAPAPYYSPGGGGAGGGASKTTAGNPVGGAGGHGGGGVRLVSSSSIDVAGNLQAVGASGRAATLNQGLAGGGGGGAGGAILIAAPIVTIRAGSHFAAFGGSGGQGFNLAASGQRGGAGAPGHVYIASDALTYDGDSSNPDPEFDSFTRPNAPPAVVADSYSVPRGTVLTVAAPGVLGNDSDLESEDLSAAVAMTTNHGTLVLSPNGGFTYTPAPHFHGQDSFSYRAEDVHGASAPITVAIDVVLLGQRDLSFGGGDGQVSFASGVTVTSTTGSALQRDGKTVMAGAAKPVAQSDGDFWLARFNANGTRDTAFGTAGSVFTEFAGFDDAVHAVAMLEVDANPAHDLIVAVGQAHNSAGPIDTDLALAVYRLDGSLVVQRRETAPTGPSTSGGYDYGLGVATQSPDTIAVAGTSSGKAIVDLYTLTNTLTTPTLSAAQPFVFPNGSNDIGSSVAFMNNMAGQPCVVMGLSVLIGAGRFATVARFRRDTAALDTTYYTTGYSHLNGNMNLNQNISVGTVPSDPATVLVAVPDAGQNWIIWGSHAQGVDGNGAEQLGSISYFINMGEATGMTGLAIDPVSHGAVVVGWTGTSYKVVRMESWQSTDPDFGKFGLITVDAAFGPSLQPAVRPDRHILVPGASSGIMQLLSLDGDDEAPAAVTGLLVTPTDGGVDVSWSPSPEADVVDYELCLTAEPVLTDDCAAVASTNTHQLLLSSLTNGTAYRVGVGAVDSTSNRSPIASVAVTPRIPTVLSQSPATALSTKYGLQTTFSATLRRSDTNAVLSGQPVTLEARRSGTVTYAQVAGPVLTTGAGVATITTAAAFSGAYRLRYAGTQTVAAATSASRAVTVAATVSAAISTTTAPLGYPLRITGTVRPAHSTPKLQLQRYTSSWQTIATTTPTSTGSYTFNLTPSTTGSYAYRVRFPGDTDHAAGVSTTQRVTVYDVTLTTVHPTSPEYVDLRNLGTKTVAIGGWRLSSASTGRSVVLPAYRLAAGATVRMFVGKGGATAKTIYLQQTAALLADTHDTLRLRDPAKHIACTRGY